MDFIEKNTRLVVDNLDAQIYLIDKNFQIIDYNKSFADHVKLSRQQILGQPCHKLTHNSDIACWEMKDTICPAKDAFERRIKCRTIHKHIVKKKIIIEEVISTPLDNGKYVLEEFRNLSELLGLVQGILPICIKCKKVRDKHGDWHEIEGYLHNKTGADFSHAICPECATRFYPELKHHGPKQ